MTSVLVRVRGAARLAVALAAAGCSYDWSGLEPPADAGASDAARADAGDGGRPAGFTCLAASECGSGYCCESVDDAGAPITDCKSAANCEKAGGKYHCASASDCPSSRPTCERTSPLPLCK